MAVIIVIALRLIVPLTILRWPLAGALLSMVLDAVDVALVDAIASVLGQPGEFGPFYAQIDKWLDLWYLGLELWVTRRWTETLSRRAAAGLFGWRLIGVILFEITVSHPLLFLFPNLFENFYLYVLLVRRFAPRLEPRTGPQLVLVLVVLFIPKAIQEYILHVEEMHPWQWLRNTVIEPVLGDWVH
jgi:hypothetical protein